MYFLEVNEVRQDADRARLGAVIPAHIEWVKQQIAGGRIDQAGKWGEAGGMAIILATDITEARNILDQDPLVQSGLINFKLAEFYPMVEMK